MRQTKSRESKWETVFREWVESIGGHRLTDLHSEAHLTKNADFIIPPEDVVLELKELRAKDHEAAQKAVNAEVAKYLEEHPYLNRTQFTAGTVADLPQAAKKRVGLRLCRTVDEHLKSANNQIKATKAQYSPHSIGILMVINDGNRWITPNMFCSAVSDFSVPRGSGSGFSAIDCVIYVSLDMELENKEGTAPAGFWIPIVPKDEDDSRVDPRVKPCLDKLYRSYILYLRERTGLQIPLDGVLDLDQLNSLKFTGKRLCLASGDPLIQ